MKCHNLLAPCCDDCIHMRDRSSAGYNLSARCWIEIITRFTISTLPTRGDSRRRRRRSYRSGTSDAAGGDIWCIITHANNHVLQVVSACNVSALLMKRSGSGSTAEWGDTGPGDRFPGKTAVIHNLWALSCDPGWRTRTQSSAGHPFIMIGCCDYSVRCETQIYHPGRFAIFCWSILQFLSIGPE